MEEEPWSRRNLGGHRAGLPRHAGGLGSAGAHRPQVQTSAGSGQGTLTAAPHASCAWGRPGYTAGRRVPRPAPLSEAGQRPDL